MFHKNFSWGPWALHIHQVSLAAEATRCTVMTWRLGMLVLKKLLLLANFTGVTTEVLFTGLIAHCKKFNANWFRCRRPSVVMLNNGFGWRLLFLASMAAHDVQRKCILITCSVPTKQNITVYGAIIRVAFSWPFTVRPFFLDFLVFPPEILQHLRCSQAARHLAQLLLAHQGCMAP